ncbi:hypothetical protein E2562_013561 [Oryza meyeriana var. granulata]|uniref:Uncharacterized protein n=1 Tax=Oryza meyeriana var. granulata TaxID=110450 RepID=A0A6G1D4E7_9ORYZ|nr:hypothetical protein E2562_013561 [Oryza meyeriana var. granulata]
MSGGDARRATPYGRLGGGTPPTRAVARDEHTLVMIVTNESSQRADPASDMYGNAFLGDGKRHRCRARGRDADATEAASLSRCERGSALSASHARCCLRLCCAPLARPTVGAGDHHHVPARLTVSLPCARGRRPCLLALTGGARVPGPHAAGTAQRHGQAGSVS